MLREFGVGLGLSPRMSYKHRDSVSLFNEVVNVRPDLLPGAQVPSSLSGIRLRIYISFNFLCVG